MTSGRRRRAPSAPEPEVRKESAPASPDELRPRIGYWSRSNVARFGELVRPLIFDREIRRRLPGARVHAYAPLGPRHGTALGDGPAPADLGHWSPARAAELADALDCIVIGGEDAIRTSDARLSSDYGPDAEEALRTRPSSFFVEALGPELERRCPVAWDAVEVPAELHRAGALRLREALASRAYLSVRSPESRDRLVRAGIENPIAVVPDPLRLLPRLFSETVLSRRLEFTRHMEWFPREGEPVVVQGARSLVKSAEAIADAVAEAASARGVPVVLLELDSDAGDGEFCDAVARVLPAPIFRVPREASVVDRVAVLAHALAFVGSAPAGASAAAAFGRPSLLLETPAAVADLPEALGRLLAAPRAAAGPSPELENRLDAHFDALAGVAEDAFARRLRQTGDPVPRLLHLLRESDRRLDAWRVAWEARSRQVVEGRLQMAGILEKREVDRTARDEELARELSQARSERDTSGAQASRLSESLASPSEKLAAVEAELSGAAAEIARLRADHARIEFALDEAHERVRSLGRDLEAARDEAARAIADGGRRAGRAEKAFAELRAEVERAEARLHTFRAGEAELRLSQTLLFTELAEAWSDASQSIDRAARLEESLRLAERERDGAREDALRLRANVDAAPPPPGRRPGRGAA